MNGLTINQLVKSQKKTKQEVRYHINRMLKAKVIEEVGKIGNEKIYGLTDKTLKKFKKVGIIR